MKSDRRHFVVVPASGLSRRMGRSKLLLPWPTKRAPNDRIIDAVLRAWTSSKVAQTVVVLRAEDEQVAAACESWPVRVVKAEANPRDMKASILLGLEFLQQDFELHNDDSCFFAPADVPGLKTHIVDQLIHAAQDRTRIVVPRYGDKVGHPSLVPWPIANEIYALGEDEGVNKITSSHPRVEVLFDANLRVDDVDNPEEYAQALKRHRLFDK